MSSEEGVQTFCEYIMADETTSKAEKKSVLQALQELLEKMIDCIRGLMKRGDATRGAAEGRRLAEQLDTAERGREIIRQYMRELDVAVKNAHELAGQEDAAANKNTQAASVASEGEKYSVKNDKEGRPFVEVDGDVLEGVAPENYIRTVQNAIREKFPNGFYRNGWKIELFREGIKEFTSSGYSRKLRHVNNEQFADKLRMASNIDEIIEIGENLRNEPARHNDKKAVSYNRVDARVRVGGNDYTVELLTRIRPDTKEMFYDIVNIQSTQMKSTTGKQFVTDESARPTDTDMVLSTNIMPQTDENVKFSLNTPVEETKDLIAVHGVTSEKLLQALELGGMPYPSIAVVKAEQGHNKYGEISLVFGKDTIDPKANRKNHVYGTDAWTVTAPETNWAVDDAASSRMYRVLWKLQEEMPRRYQGDVSSWMQNFDAEASNYSQAELVDKALRNAGMKAAYLESVGKHVEMVQAVRQPQYNPERAALYEGIAEAYGLTENSRMSGSEFMEKYGFEKLKGLLVDEYMRRGMTQEKARARADGLKRFALFSYVHDCISYLKEKNDTTVRYVDDADATERQMDKDIDKGEYKKWLEKLTEGVIGERGIWNGKERFTPAGNRRSFWQTHNRYTLENIVKEMDKAKGKGAIQGFGGATTLQARTAREYKSIQDIRSDRGRLQQMEDADYSNLIKAADERIDEITSEILADNEGYGSNRYESREIVGEELQAAAAGSGTVAAIAKHFVEAGYKISEQTARKIQTMYQQIAELPTGYFEAKPERAVGFEEVRAAVVPDDVEAKVVTGLEEAGVPIVYYPAGDNVARTDALNGMNDLKFSLNTEQEQFREDKYFASQVGKWQELKDGSRVKVGVIRAGSALNQVGFADSTVYMDASKLQKEMSAHGDHLTPETMKQLPQLLNAPVVITEAQAENTANVFGELVLEDGTPIMVGIMVAKDRAGRIALNKIRTIHARKDFANLINDQTVLYLDTNKNKTKAWFQVRGNVVPLEGTKFGLIRSINLVDENVKQSVDADKEVEQENRELARENMKLAEQVKILKEEMQLSGGHKMNRAAVKELAGKILREYSSKYDRATLEGELHRYFEYIANDPDANFEDALDTGTALMRAVIEQSDQVSTELRDAYQPVREMVRSLPWGVKEGSPEYYDLLSVYGDGRNGGNSWGNVRRALFGRVNVQLVQGSGNMDTSLAVLAEAFPGEFDAEGGVLHGVGRILEIFEASQPVHENPYGMDLDGEAVNAAQELMEAYMETPERHTYADRQAAKVMELKAEFRNKRRAALEAQRTAFDERLREVKQNQAGRMTELREQYRKANQQGKTEVAERYKQQMDKLREGNAEALAKQKATFDLRMQRRNEGLQWRTARDQVQKQARRLYKWVSAPTDANHVQTRMERAVLNLLDAFDWNTGREGSKEKMRWQEAMKDIALLVAQANGDAEGVGIDYTDFDPDLPAAINELIPLAQGNLSIGEFTAMQMQKLNGILTSLTHSVTQANKLLADTQNRGIAAVADASCMEMAQAKQAQFKTRHKWMGALADTKAYDKIAGLTVLDTMDAGRYFHSLGAGAESIYKNLCAGFDTRVWRLKEAKTAMEGAPGGCG